jgi:hypothetical protein
MSVCPSMWNNSTSIGRIVMKFYIRGSIESLSGKYSLHYSLPTITGTLHADRCTFVITSRWILLRMRNVSDKSCRENQNTHFVFSNFLSKTVPFVRLCGRYCGSTQAIDDNMAPSQCMLDNQDYKHNLRAYNTYSFTTPTMVTRTRLSITCIRKLPIFWMLSLAVQKVLTGLCMLITQPIILCIFKVVSNFGSHNSVYPCPGCSCRCPSTPPPSPPAAQTAWHSFIHAKRAMFCVSTLYS